MSNDVKPFYKPKYVDYTPVNGYMVFDNGSKLNLKTFELIEPSLKLADPSLECSNQDCRCKVSKNEIEGLKRE